MTSVAFSSVTLGMCLIFTPFFIDKFKDLKIAENRATAAFTELNEAISKSKVFDEEENLRLKLNKEKIFNNTKEIVKNLKIINTELEIINSKDGISYLWEINRDVTSKFKRAYRTLGHLVKYLNNKEKIDRFRNLFNKE